MVEIGLTLMFVAAPRHWEGRSDEAMQAPNAELDCFTSFAMTSARP
jgi:hypothetical protein